MGWLSRLFGRKEAGRGEQTTPLSLQILFPGRLRLGAPGLTRAMRGVHPSLAEARCEEDPRGETLEASLVQVTWGEHRVEVVGFETPMPSEVVERCVAPAHYGAALKERARAHATHALLFYRGEEKDPLRQYEALGLVASALASQGALVVLNESGHTSLPAEPLAPEEGEDLLELWRTMPLTALFVGFVKLEVEGVEGVWMRTYGAHRLGLPDLAWHARGHDEGRATFELFAGLLAYLRSSGARFAAGHTAELGPRQVRLRAPRRDESFLDSPGELFVVEPRQATSMSL